MTDVNCLLLGVDVIDVKRVEYAGLCPCLPEPFEGDVSS
jgi:hypothetical protein